MNVRALIDNGSQASFITEKVVEALGLQRRVADVNIFGIGSSAAGRSCSQVEVTVASKLGDERIQIRPYVLTNVTGTLPALSPSSVPTSFMEGMQLADADATASKQSTSFWVQTYMHKSCGTMYGVRQAVN